MNTEAIDPASGDKIRAGRRVTVGCFYCESAVVKTPELRSNVTSLTQYNYNEGQTEKVVIVLSDFFYYTASISSSC